MATPEVEVRPGPPCISCRLKRKKCDRQLPICTRCVELQVPLDLCIYRENNGFYDKETPYALAKEKRRNTELLSTVERLRLLLEVANSSDGRQHEIFTLKNSTSGAGKLLQLNPLRNPLFCTLVENDHETQHLGSMAVAALIDADPKVKLVVNQVNQVLSRERQKYTMDVDSMARDQVMLDAFEQRCIAITTGMQVFDGDEIISGLIAEIQSKLPLKSDMDNFMYQFTAQNKGRWIGVPFADMEVLSEIYTNLFEWTADGRAILKVSLPEESHKLEGLAFFMIFLAWMTFMRTSRIHPRLPPDVQRATMNYVLFSRYSQALLEVDTIGQNIKLGSLTESPVTTCTLLVHHLFEKYSAVSNYLVEQDIQTVSSLTTKRLITLAKYQHLHEDIDRWYPRWSADGRRSLKSLWYNIVLLDLLDCIDCGALSTIQPTHLMTADGQHHHILADAVAALHWAVYDFNFIDDVLLLDDLLRFIETSTIPKLKKCFTGLGVSSDEGIKFSESFDSSRYGDEPYMEQHMIAAQRAMLRYLIYAVMASLYHVCLVRFIQNGEDKSSERYQRVLMLATKYSLASLQLYKLHLRVLNVTGNCDDPKRQSFHFSVMLFLNPFITVALKRATLVGFSVLGNVLSVDTNVVANYMLYGNSLARDDGILRMCHEKGYTYQEPDMAAVGDFDIDNDPVALRKKWGKYIDDPRHLVGAYCGIFKDVSEFSKMKCLSINFMKMSKSYTFGMKYFSYCLNHCLGAEYTEWRLQNPDVPEVKKEQEYTFNNTDHLHSSSNNVPIDPETGNSGTFGGSFKDLFESSISTKSSREFSFLNFFGSHMDVPKDEIDDYFRRANE